MENLPLIEQEALGILKRLERCCQSAEQRSPEKVKEDGFIRIVFSDIDFSIFQKTEDIYDVEKYLQNNDVDFYIEGNSLIDRFPGVPINKYLPFNNNTQLGIIKGKNIQEIKTKIKELISKLSSDAPAREETRVRRHFEIIEEIEVKNLGIKIQNNGFISKGKDKFEINPTDQALIHYLHYRFTEEKGQCVPVSILAKDLGQAEGYIVNRISFINQEIRKLVLNGKTTSTIDDFIKNEKGRGYHLNPRFVIDFIKRK